MLINDIKESNIEINDVKIKNQKVETNDLKLTIDKLNI